VQRANGRVERRLGLCGTTATRERRRDVRERARQERRPPRLLGEDGALAVRRQRIVVALLRHQHVAEVVQQRGGEGAITAVACQSQAAREVALGGLGLAERGVNGTEPRQRGADLGRVAGALGQLERDPQRLVRFGVPSQRGVGLREMEQGQVPLARLALARVGVGRRRPSRNGLFETAPLERLGALLERRVGRRLLRG